MVTKTNTLKEYLEQLDNELDNPITTKDLNEAYDCGLSDGFNDGMFALLRLVKDLNADQLKTLNKLVSATWLEGKDYDNN